MAPSVAVAAAGPLNAFDAVIRRGQRGSVVGKDQFGRREGGAHDVRRIGLRRHLDFGMENGVPHAAAAWPPGAPPPPCPPIRIFWRACIWALFWVALRCMASMEFFCAAGVTDPAGTNLTSLLRDSRTALPTSEPAPTSGSRLSSCFTTTPSFCSPAAS